jgi:hypothetical protein
VVKYGYKDQSLDLLRRSYFHLWDKTGDHIGWRNWSAHSEKCTDAGIDSLPERTFYRWLGIEKTAHGKPKAGDEQLDFLHRPIRHQSQISGFLERVEGEGRNLLKKGWDQLYMDPINKEGFLEEAKKAQKDAAEKREKDKQVSLFQAMKDWEAKHGNISQFDASKVDVMSIHEQVALNVSSVESKYHKM